MPDVTAASVSQSDPSRGSAGSVTKNGTDTSGYIVNATEQGTDASGNLLVVLTVSGKMDSLAAAPGIKPATGYTPVVLTPTATSKSNNQTFYVTVSVGNYTSGANWSVAASVVGGSNYTFVKGRGGEDPS